MRYFILTIAALTALVLIAPVTIAFASLAAAEQGESNSNLCGPGGLAAQPTADLPSSVGGYSGQQLENAAAIMRAGATLEVGLHGQTLAVMTAMGESSLINVDYGDEAGPDSRGLFQQRDNGAWGTYADRMDPHTAASNFYRALLRVDDWEILPPTVAAHRVQRNADVNHYARYWPSAVEIVTALADHPEGANFSNASTAADCATMDRSVTAQGWVNPTPGRLTSQFGQRIHPVTGVSSNHAGSDVANRCGTPIKAAAGGVVLRAAPGRYQGRTGNQIILDHGGGVTTRYGHVLTGSMTVRAGDRVGAGMSIAAMGGDPSVDSIGAGSSTGCHLHFEVNINGVAVNPNAYLLAQGVVLGTD